MKKIFVLLFLLIAAIGAAQNGISYQAVLLNPNGEQLPGADNSKIPLVNSSICLRFSIAASSGGTPEYQETITTRTDAFGMVNVTIGTGNPTPGSPSFNTISWGSGPKNLKVELDLTGLCTSFITVSDQPFTSVPFALYALNSGSGGGSSTTTLTGDVSGTGTGTIATSIANNAVTTTKIADSNVTNAKLQNSSITINGNTVDLGGTATINASPIGTALTSGNVLVGSASNLAAEVTMNGDVTITNAGVTTIGVGKVDNSKLDKTNIPLSGFGAASANVALGGNKLSGVADPTLAQDAATKNYVDLATSAINTLADGKIYLGNASNVADEVTINGDVTMTNAGVTAIGTGKVTDAKLDKTNIPLSGFGAAVADVDLGTKKLIGVANPTLAQDAATKSYVDSATGAINTLADGKIYLGNASNVADEVTMNGDVTMTNAGVTAIGTGKVTDAKLDKTNIPLSGFGAAVADVDLGTKKLIGVANPTLAQDAATKSYVDSATGAINTLADGKIYLGNATNVADEVTMNGDVTISNTGATTIVPNAVTSNKIADSNVTNAKLQNSSITINGNTVALGGTATINASPVGTALTSGNVLVGSASNLATEVTMNGDVTISNTGATTIVPNAVTSNKIQDGTITNDDINSAAAIQTTKIKGFYTGIYIIGSTGSAVSIPISNLIPSIVEIYSTSTIIFQSNSPGLIVLNSEPKDTDFNSTFDAINIIFNANSAVGQKLSYIIILNN